MTTLICPLCKENNNPSFTSCWKCGSGFDGSPKVPLIPLKENNVEYLKKPIPFYWFFVGGGAFQILMSFYRDFVTTQRYASFGEIILDIVPAIFGLTVMTLINGAIFYAIYWAVMKSSKK